MEAKHADWRTGKKADASIDTIRYYDRIHGAVVVAEDASPSLNNFKGGNG